jgi:hypothetical protein
MKTTPLLFLTFLIHLALSDISQEAKDLATQWGPLVWLHPEDPFFPSNVDFFLEQMEARGFFNNRLVNYIM